MLSWSCVVSCCTELAHHCCTLQYQSRWPAAFHACCRPVTPSCCFYNQHFKMLLPPNMAEKTAAVHWKTFSKLQSSRATLQLLAGLAQHWNNALPPWPLTSPVCTVLCPTKRILKSPGTCHKKYKPHVTPKPEAERYCQHCCLLTLCLKAPYVPYMAPAQAHTAAGSFKT